MNSLHEFRMVDKFYQLNKLISVLCFCKFAINFDLFNSSVQIAEPLSAFHGGKKTRRKPIAVDLLEICF